MWQAQYLVILQLATKDSTPPRPSTLSTITLNISQSTPHSTLRAFCTAQLIFHIRNPHSTIYTLHSALYTPHSTLHTSPFTLYTPHFTLYTLHFTLYTPHFRLYTLHFTLQTLHCTLDTSHSARYIPHSTWHYLHTPHCALHPIPYTTVYAVRSQGKIYKTVEIICFTQVFDVSAFGFIG